MEYYKLSVAVNEAKKCVSVFGEDYVVTNEPYGKFDVMPLTHVRRWHDIAHTETVQQHLDSVTNEWNNQHDNN